MPDQRFARNIADLIESTITFSDHPEYWREAVGSSPKYFTHYLDKGRHRFGLSKYCAFRDVPIQQYVSRLRNTTNGNVTQRHISKTVGLRWNPFAKSTPEVCQAFSQWIHTFFPAYRVQKASFITLINGGSQAHPQRRRPSAISPHDLQKKLSRQTKVGNVGELIALKHEIHRLKQMGIPHPEECVEHVSKLNSSAGFDIWSRPSRTSVRFIEVKSSTSASDSFFITKNELDTLREHGSDAYLYFVFVRDIDESQGEVVLELPNPVEHLESHGSLEAVLFRAELDKKGMSN